MRRRDSSMKAQNPLVDAGEALDRAENATTQARSYPTSENVQQAENSIRHASNAVSQTTKSDNEIAEKNLQTRLSKVKETLANTQDSP